MDADLDTLATALYVTTDTRWLRYARANLPPMFPHLPQQSGYNKRLRRLADH